MYFDQCPYFDQYPSFDQYPYFDQYPNKHNKSYIIKQTVLHGSVRRLPLRQKLCPLAQQPPQHNSRYLKQNTHQGTVAKQVVMYTSCCKFSGKYYCFVKLYYFFYRNVVLTSQQYNITSQQQYHGNQYQQEVNMTTHFASAPQCVFYLRY